MRHLYKIIIRTKKEVWLRIHDLLLKHLILKKNFKKHAKTTVFILQNLFRTFADFNKKKNLAQSI
ncbi:hypothetical protein D0T49_04715 [Paludibacter sp. 221]|nr:hypothetical protein [Paludibacter sp. 221]